MRIGFAHPVYRFAALVPATLESRHFSSPEELAAGIGTLDVLVAGARWWDNALIARAGRLRLIQSVTAGVEHLDLSLLRARGIRLATAQGCADIAVAEHALGLMLALTRQLHLARDNQSRRRYRPMIAEPALREGELHGRTLLLAGFGPIGKRIAALAKAFGMTVLCIRNTPAPGDAVDEMHGLGALHELLPRADIVALACPLTRETARMIDARALACMKPSALLVNVARGGLVDEAALVAALAGGAIAGAALDCFEAEPLPADSPLWDMSQVIVTPHSAWSSPLYEKRIAEVLLDNLGRLARGERLRNEIV